MAVLALTSDLQDLRQRLARMVVATTFDGRRITAEDLKCAGAMTVLLLDAIKPNLLQTLEGGPASFTAAVRQHRSRQQQCPRRPSGPGDVRDRLHRSWLRGRHGRREVLRYQMPPERPAARRAVMVATVRALKMHGGVGRIVAGRPLDPALAVENVEAVRKGSANLAAQIENVRVFNVPVVVAINHFPGDTEAEVAAIREVAMAAGARDVVVSRHFEEAGRGEDLARAVWSAAEEGAPGFRLLYPDDSAAREDRDGRGPDLRRRGCGRASCRH